MTGFHMIKRRSYPEKGMLRFFLVYAGQNQDDLT